MKKVLTVFILILAQSAIADDEMFGGVTAPYTLAGQPNNCTLTILEKGFEVDSPKEDLELLKVKNAYADVSIGGLPGVVFHLKPENNRSIWTGYDGNTGYRLKVLGVRIGSKILFLRSQYTLSKGNSPKKPEARCQLTTLQK